MRKAAQPQIATAAPISAPPTHVRGHETRENAAPPIVHEALRSPGRPLDSETRAFFEPRFGHDFGNVRVHADERASESAGAIGAQAYTIGSDVVLGCGRHAQMSDSGRHLMAHELAHVVQQNGNRQPTGEPAVGRPGSVAEQEADRIAANVVMGVNSVTPRQHVNARVIHRSLLGTIIGGVVGGAVGSLFGPVGAVVGATIGAGIGEAASNRERSLSPAEKTYVRGIFYDSLDYDKVRIKRGGIASTFSAVTTGNTINLESSDFVGKTMTLSPDGELTLIHEMGHVWQYQNGGLRYIRSSLGAQFKAWIKTGSRDAAYSWLPSAKAHVPWAEWNAEQQASCISDCNEAMRRIDAGRPVAGSRKTWGDLAGLDDYAIVSIALPYLQRVWNKEGAPGQKRSETDVKPPASGRGP